MAVSFNQIPQVYKLFAVSIEVDPSQAGTPTQPKFALIIDYKIAAGTAVLNKLIACGSVAQAKVLGGIGSPLARAFEAYFALDKVTPIYLMPLDPPSGGVAASGALQVSNAPTAAGTLSLYVAGQKVAVGVAASDTAAQVATKINAAINAATSLPVTSTVSTDTVTLTAKWKGITGNDIRVEDSYLGPNGGEVLPAGLALTYPANNVLASGAGVPDLTAAIANLGDEPFEYVSYGHTDTGSLGALATEYGFSDSGRWGWMRESYGHIFTAKRDTYSNLASFGPTLNYPMISGMAVEKTAPTPVWEWAAQYTARAARSLGNDPARPLHTLEFNNVLPAPKGARFSKTELNSLAQVGLAIQTVSGNGYPMIMREQSFYQKNTLGQPDNAYELVTTLATLAEVFRRLKSVILSKYSRHKLANDGTRAGPGQAIVTPKVIKGELIAMYNQLEYLGLVENSKAFKAALIVERDETDPNRVNVLFAPDLTNQLRHVAVLGQFRLQYPTAAAA